MQVNFIEQGYEILSLPDDVVSMIAGAARTCYRSEGNASRENDVRLVKSLIRRGHEAMIEHGGTIAVRFKCDRAIANELVRHRLFSFAQESTRYVGYSDRGFEFILPELDESDEHMVDCIMTSCAEASDWYTMLTDEGATPEVARAVLPLCTATEIVVSGNPREWRHMFRLRCDRHAHPQMRRLMIPLLHELQGRVPVVFDDIEA